MEKVSADCQGPTVDALDDDRRRRGRSERRGAGAVECWTRKNMNDKVNNLLSCLVLPATPPAPYIPKQAKQLSLQR
jgi:hypothetical protein